MIPFFVSIQVDGDNSVQVVLKPKTDTVIRKSDLVYFEKSPNFCEPDAALGLPGTVGRHCNRSTDQPDSCETLCCGRGYNTLSLTTTHQCQCQFQWCCDVICKKCTQTDWVTVCKWSSTSGSTLDDDDRACLRYINAFLVFVGISCRSTVGTVGLQLKQSRAKIMNGLDTESLTLERLP